MRVYVCVCERIEIVAGEKHCKLINTCMIGIIFYSLSFRRGLGEGRCMSQPHPHCSPDPVVYRN